MTAGLYIHIPFCPQVCGYCDFYKVAHRGSAQVSSYLDGLKKEIFLYSDEPATRSLTFETLYFGGGTPSLLKAAELEEIIRLIFEKFEFLTAPEITVEADPGTVDLDKLRAFRTAGVNRLSLGIQSFHDEELKFLDRTHTAEEAISTLEMARSAGFDNISIDLIFGLPDQTLLKWEANLQTAIELSPQHISPYSLTFEDGTPLMVKLRKGLVQKSPEDRQRKMYLHTIDFLSANGFDHYEVSNFAKPGRHSQHNLKYWNGNPYIGLGTSAHSFIGKRRFWNVSHLKKYRDALAENRFPIAGEENLLPADLVLEKIYLSLRQRTGLHLKDLEAEYGFDFFERYFSALTKFFDGDFQDSRFISELRNGDRALESHWVEFEAGSLRLTKEGFAMCDAICAEFVPPPVLGGG